MNTTACKEWLNKAWHHFSSGKILYEANHYTDVIGIDLHYAVEVTLKSFLAYENKKIAKSHDLVEVYKLVREHISFTEEELDLLELISTYHLRGSYPPKDRKMPDREEIKKVLEFAEKLFYKVCDILEVDRAEVMR